MSDPGEAATNGTGDGDRNIPAGLTLLTMSGAGNCPNASNSCSRNDSMALDKSRPAITVTVAVPSMPRPGWRTALRSAAAFLSVTAPRRGVTKIHPDSLVRGKFSMRLDAAGGQLSIKMPTVQDRT
jgi:hypothetical protein